MVAKGSARSSTLWGNISGPWAGMSSLKPCFEKVNLESISPRVCLLTWLVISLQTKWPAPSPRNVRNIAAPRWAAPTSPTRPSWWSSCPMVRLVPTGGVFLGRLIGLGLSAGSPGLLGTAISKPGGQQGRPRSR